MRLEQIRFLFAEEATLSRLYITEYAGMKQDTPLFICYILEDRVRETRDDKGVCRPPADWKIKCTTAIPVGEYVVVSDLSTRFNKQMLHLLNVKGYEGIRVHSGNTNHDTEGCLICGNEVNERTVEVMRSRDALKVVQDSIKGALKRDEVVTWKISGLIPAAVSLPYKIEVNLMTPDGSELQIA